MGNLPKRLSRSEFESALRKGQGRAFMYVREFGLEGVEDLVLEACLHSQVLDWQTEGSHADWLFMMIKDLPQYPYFREAILTAFSTATKTADLLQFCRLAESMVDLGDEEAKEAIRQFVYRTVQSPQKDEWLDIYAVATWVFLKGADGLLEITRFYGERLASNPEDFPDPRNLRDLEGFGIDLDYRKILKQAAEHDALVRNYWERVLESKVLDIEFPIPKEEQKRAFREHRRKFRKEFPVETILENARNKVGKRNWNYRRFGIYATRREEELVYQQLLKTTDDDVRIRLLWVFSRVPPPGCDLRFLEWANASNPQLKVAAIQMLEHIQDRRVYDLAVSKVTQGQVLGPDNRVFDLFIENYDQSVPGLITQALAKIEPSDEDADRLGMSIIAMSTRHKDPNLVSPLKWVYENTPCSFCRYSVVQDLDEYHAIDEGMFEECRYDSYEDIRNHALKLLEKRHENGEEDKAIC